MSGDFWRRLRLPWIGRREMEAEIDDELAFHLEMRTRELVEDGLDAEEARTRVREGFGDVAATRRHYLRRRSRRLRRERFRAWLAELGQDLRYGLRTLGQRRAFSFTVVLVLGLGIGASTTVFTLINTIFFRHPAHVEDPGRLVRVFRAWEGGGGGSLGNPDYEYYRDNASTLEGLAAFGGSRVASYATGTDRPDQLRLLHVSGNYFDLLGVAPSLGRWFGPEENRTPGTHPVMVVSYDFWIRALGGDPEVLGRGIDVNGHAFTVVGVAPRGFRGISPVGLAHDAWVPIAMYGTLTRASDDAWWQRQEDNRDRWLSLVGRMSDGVTFEAAQENLVALGEGLSYRGKDPGEGALVTRQFLYPPRQEATLVNLSRMLLVVVGIVLAISVANVTVLLLSRATTRHREIGIRTALGAGRARLFRQLLAESLVLGLAGGLLGVGLAYLSAEVAASLLPYAFATSFTPDARVLAAATALSLVTSVTIGLAPAIHAAGADVKAVIKEQGRRGGGGRIRGVLVAAQVSLSVVLLAGALLFAQSFRAADTQELGFDRSGVLIVQTDLRSLGYDAEASQALISRGLDRILALPGVGAATVSRQVPFQGDWSTEIGAPPGSIPTTRAGGEDRIWVGLNAVGPDYFETMDIPIVMGRGLTREDVAGAPGAMVVNKTLARHLWPGRNPVGQVLQRGDGYQVVGVARDASYYALGEEPTTQAYLAALQSPQPRVSFFVRTEGDPARHAPAVQAALRELDASLAFSRVTTLESLVEDEVARYEVSAVLVSLFSLIALLLAATGLYGVVGFFVAQRTREIGVRMALGADRTRVARQVMQSGLRLALLGVVPGLGGILLLRGLTAPLLYGVEPGAPLPVVGACLALLVATAVATAGPARRATRIDPLDAIRTE